MTGMFHIRGFSHVGLVPLLSDYAMKSGEVRCLNKERNVFFVHRRGVLLLKEISLGSKL
jgi:hypothetical protein